MADLPGDFWSGWIIVLTLVSFSVIAWLIWSVYFSSSPHPQQEHDNEPVWDKNLREGNAPAPMWWFWFVLGATVFSVGYLMLYPGLGSFSGALNWSQDARVRGSHANYENQFEDVRNQVAASPLEAIQADAALMQTAERIFQRECAACHGKDATGQAALFPNLMDREWQWGGAPEQIEQTLRDGRQANMIAWEGTIPVEDIGHVADYVLQMHAVADNAAPASGTQGGTDDHPGQTTYNTYCVACHGTEGNGNAMLGAPALNDNVWLYGSERRHVIASIAEGRQGEMPAFGNRLDDAQIRLLVAWLTRSQN